MIRFPARPTLAVAVLWRALIVMVLWRVRRRRFEDLLRAVPPLGEGRGGADDVRFLVGYTDRWRALLGFRCFERSLVLLHFLRRRGFATDVHLGLRREGNEVEGHTWLSKGGVVLFEPDGDPASVFPELARWTPGTDGKLVRC